MAKDNVGKTNNNDGDLHHRHPFVAPPLQYAQPLDPPGLLGPPPPKRHKTNLFTSNSALSISSEQQPVQGNQFFGSAVSAMYTYPANMYSSLPPDATTVATTPSSKKKKPRASSSATGKTKTKAAKAKAKQKVKAKEDPSMQNPYSTARGLRHFSMKVCEKVEEKGTTTYNEVADELVRELRQAEEAINKAAIARGETPAKKKKSSKDGKTKKKNHEDKNIRRRVYDALNVLMAMDIISKEKKEITWRGLPGSRVQDHFGDGSGNDGDGKHRRNGLGRRQRVQQLEDEVAKRQQDIKRKRDCLQELMTQNVCFRNLLARNYAREEEEKRNNTSSSFPAQEKQEEDGAQDDTKQPCEVKDIKNEKIPVPFIIVSTDSKAVVQCEMCPKRANVSFDFSLPFEINDDNEILKRLGMNHTSEEVLQRSLPPDVFRYCNDNGLLQNITQNQEKEKW